MSEFYYLRKEPTEAIASAIKKTDGTIIPEEKYIIEERAIYKDNRFSRFYRKDFKGLDNKRKGMRLYTCKTLKTILGLRQSTFDYCGEWFDVYDENGKLDPQPPTKG